MSTIDLQTEIVQMIKDENDTSILDAIRTLLYKLQQGHVDDDITDEECAEFDEAIAKHERCLLYTSDAADERSSVDLGGRRIIKKKTRKISNANQYGRNTQLQCNTNT
mgnify:CR=1 FL=1